MHYAEIWQTWSLLDPNAAPVQTASVMSSADARMDDFRHLVQQARIQKRMSITVLAGMVGCDCETLAAFERGDEILCTATHKRIKDVLRI